MICVDIGRKTMVVLQSFVRLSLMIIIIAFNNKGIETTNFVNLLLVKGKSRYFGRT